MKLAILAAVAMCAGIVTQDPKPPAPAASQPSRADKMHSHERTASAARSLMGWYRLMDSIKTLSDHLVRVAALEIDPERAKTIRAGAAEALDLLISLEDSSKQVEGQVERIVSAAIDMRCGKMSRTTLDDTIRGAVAFVSATHTPVAARVAERLRTIAQFADSNPFQVPTDRWDL